MLQTQLRDEIIFLVLLDLQDVSVMHLFIIMISVLIIIIITAFFKYTHTLEIALSSFLVKTLETIIFPLIRTFYRVYHTINVFSILPHPLLPFPTF